MRINHLNHKEALVTGTQKLIAMLPAIGWRIIQRGTYKRLVKLYGKACVRVVDNAIKIDLPA